MPYWNVNFQCSLPSGVHTPCRTYSKSWGSWQRSPLSPTSRNSIPQIPQTCQGMSRFLPRSSPSFKFHLIYLANSRKEPNQPKFCYLQCTMPDAGEVFTLHFQVPLNEYNFSNNKIANVQSQVSQSVYFRVRFSKPSNISSVLTPINNQYAYNN